MNHQPSAIAAEPRAFLSRPPLWRLALLAALGGLLAAGALAYRRARRPGEVSPETAARALAEVRAVLAAVRESEFGRSGRGRALTGRAAEFLARGRIRFSAELASEALYRREAGCAPLLYVRVIKLPRGPLLPSREELAERVYHETLHALKNSARKSWEEECDAFCAAAEARAALSGKAPSFPLRRDELVLWEWVRRAYPALDSDPAYRPVGRSMKKLARMAGKEVKGSD